MLRLEANLTRTPSGTASLALIGKFNDLTIGPKPLTGGLDARVVPNTDFTAATVAARFEIADFANVVTEVSEGRQGAAVATLMGSYSAIDKIGRASCREREWMCGVGVEWKREVR